MYAYVNAGVVHNAGAITQKLISQMRDRECGRKRFVKLGKYISLRDWGLGITSRLIAIVLEASWRRGYEIDFHIGLGSISETKVRYLKLTLIFRNIISNKLYRENRPLI